MWDPGLKIWQKGQKLAQILKPSIVKWIWHWCTTAASNKTENENETLPIKLQITMMHLPPGERLKNKFENIDWNTKHVREELPLYSGPWTILFIFFTIRALNILSDYDPE